jgi:hypothetical protein
MEKQWEQKPGTFHLRRNANKKQENYPDMLGQINIDGVDYELSAWTKVAASGQKWLTGTCKPLQNKTAATQPPPKSPAMPSDDSDIPFN